MARSADGSLRDADFMKILLSEITNQDPFKPQDSAQIVEGMQKLQELANSRYEKSRDDQRWARDLIGGSVSVQQAQLEGACSKHEAWIERQQGHGQRTLPDRPADGIQYGPQA